MVLGSAMPSPSKWREPWGSGSRCVGCDEQAERESRACLKELLSDQGEQEEARERRDTRAVTIQAPH